MYDFLSIGERHQLRIARRTVRLSDVGALILGGMTKLEARQIILRNKEQRAARAKLRKRNR